ncbi:helix-turn-helix domain-containing protein [Cecembia rubra]|jgi:AraC-like DNA-binding protein|uniref:helix-turn-helix domain-containing protein n=1 Tax=Cecembia rubra TaxID=1485585 RepID=UPI0027151B6A|nr:helix-turn-helix domain-containing protein [Cecembia rubra]
MEKLYFFSGSITTFFIILLMSKRDKAVYDWLLISWFSIILFHIFVFYLSANNRFSFSLELSSAAVFLNGPVLWLYTRSLFEKRISWKEVVHFLPFVINLAIIAPYALQNTLAPFSDFTRTILAWAKLGSILIYCLWSIHTINKTLRFAEDNFSNIESQHLAWLKMALKSVLFLWFIGFFSQLAVITNLFKLDLANEDLFINIAVSVLVIYMGYYGFRQAPVFLGGSLSTFAKQAGSEQEVMMEKYHHSSLDEALVKQYAKLLEELMAEKKPYIDPELNLSKLATELNLSNNQLSQVINQFYKKNFYEYINSYRIEAVKNRLANGDHKNTTLLGIALEAGFNSKATFNRFFKKYTGQTPSEYLKEQKT